MHETLDQVKEHRGAWLYNPGQRRVRRAPNVAYDNPGTAADGMRTSDQFDMFNGAVDRYNWELVGKKEMYIPYNNFRINNDRSLTYDEIEIGEHTVYRVTDGSPWVSYGWELLDGALGASRPSS